jgi:long-subunit acyl-CoA synthetase (AMP-forming)
VPLNFRAKADELKYMVRNAEAKILLVGNRYFDMANEILAQLPTVKHCISIDTKIESMPYYEDLIDSSSSDDFFGEIQDEDVTILIHTAG